MDQCELLILDWFAIRLNALDPEAVSKDDKTRLQEYLQSNKHPLPLYEVTEIKGKSHDQTFYVECNVEGLKKAVIGKGNSRRRAEQKAAKQAFENLTNDR
jgi:ribonuclease-3